MKPGDLVKHTGKPEWGVGVVVECVGDKCTVHFEEQGRLVLKLAMAGPWLVDAIRADVAADSPLLDPRRWTELERPREARAPKAKAVGGRAACSACNRALNRSQYADDRKLKACPRCSSKDGREHIFYDYPDAFGQTDARVSEATPDGAQSYCATCRAGDGPVRGARRCSSVKLR